MRRSVDGRFTGSGNDLGQRTQRADRVILAGSGLSVITLIGHGGEIMNLISVAPAGLDSLNENFMAD